MYLRSENSTARLGLYGLGIGCLGLTAAPLFAHYAMINPAILPTAIGLSAAIFASASAYAYTRPKDSLLTWGSSLYSGLIGLIGL